MVFTGPLLSCTTNERIPQTSSHRPSLLSFCNFLHFDYLTYHFYINQALMNMLIPQSHFSFFCICLPNPVSIASFPFSLLPFQHRPYLPHFCNVNYSLPSLFFLSSIQSHKYAYLLDHVTPLFNILKLFAISYRIKFITLS